MPLGVTPEKPSLQDWVLARPPEGRYAFTRADAEAAFPHRGTGVRQALGRLVKAGVLASPKHEFYIVVPLEYRREGTPPAAWFVDALMAFVRQPYYVALLTAAEFHGAAHQRPQEFQLMTDRPIRPLTYGASERGRILWVVNAFVERLPVAHVNVPTGTLRVATPETTAFDLVRYPEHAGGMDNVATVLAELGERLDATKLGDVASIINDAAAVQRLGYTLGVVGHAGLAASLKAWLEQRGRRLYKVKLRRGSDASHADPHDPVWNVAVNGALDPDI